MVRFDERLGLGLLALVCLSSVAGQAQAPVRKRTSPPAKASAAKPKTPERFPLEGLEVTGNQIYRQEQILRVVQLTLGQTVGDADFEAARERLSKTGAFQSVGYRSGPSASGQGYQVTFEVVEVPQVYRWRLEELPKTAAEVTAELTKRNPLFGERIAATREMLSGYAEEISRLTGEKVVGRLMPNAQNELEVLFRPDRPRPAVAEVRFQGMQVLPQSTLQNAIAPAAVGTLFTEEFFRTLLDRNIRPLYDARGYVRVAFPKVAATPAAGVQGLAVSVQVQEGVPYKLSSVEVRGADPLDKELTGTAAVKTGDVANFQEVAAGEERVMAALRRRGYMRPGSEIVRSYDDTKKTVGAVIQVTPGKQYRFGELKVEGLDLHSEPAVRKMWGLKPGAPFNAEYPNHFLGRITEDGVLDNLGETKSRLEVHDATLTVDVVLLFKGQAKVEKKRRETDVP